MSHDIHNICIPLVNKTMFSILEKIVAIYYVKIPLYFVLRTLNYSTKSDSILRSYIGTKVNFKQKL